MIEQTTNNRNTKPTHSQTNKATSNRGAKTFVVLHLILVFLPIITILAWAITERWSWPSLFPEVLSMRGIAEIFSYNPTLGSTLLLSVLIALIVGVLSTTIGAMAARALVLYQFPGKSLFKAGTVLPFLIPATVFAMGIQIVFIRIGLSGTVFGVILVHTIVALPYSVLLLTDITKAAGTKLEEQAKTLGATPIQVLIHIQIPQLLPGLLSSASMAYILSFSQYFLTLLIGSGKVKTFALAMFPYLVSGDRTIAAAYGTVFLLVSLVVFVIFEVLLRKYTSKSVDYYA